MRWGGRWGRASLWSRGRTGGWECFTQSDCQIGTGGQGVPSIISTASVCVVCCRSGGRISTRRQHLSALGIDVDHPEGLDVLLADHRNDADLRREEIVGEVLGVRRPDLAVV